MSMSCSWTPAQQSQAATFYAAADRWVSKARSSTCLKRPILAIVQLCNCAIVQLQVPIPCKLLPIHKCQFLANCCQFTGANTLPNIADSQMPFSCKLFPIHKCQFLAKYGQFISANSLQTVANSQVLIPCKLLPIHKCLFLANCCQFKSSNSLQAVENSAVPMP